MTFKNSFISIAKAAPQPASNEVTILQEAECPDFNGISWCSVTCRIRSLSPSAKLSRKSQTAVKTTLQSYAVQGLLHIFIWISSNNDDNIQYPRLELLQ